MKVYFDQQIWALLSDGRLEPKVIERATEVSECKYYLSVAHLEELHTSEKKETEEKKGITGKLEAFMKSYAVSGVIKETFEGIRFHEGEREYQIARHTVWKIDTMNAVQSVSDLGLLAQQSNGVNPKTLFEGRKQNPDTDYKDVWEIEIVKQLLRLFNVENVKYEDLKIDYNLLNNTMALLFGVLTASGYKRDTSEKLRNSGEYDIQHAIRATYCDAFVTNDKKLKSKYKAVAYYMGIPIEIMDFIEFEDKYAK